MLSEITASNVSSILDQAASRRLDVKKARFNPNPSTEDHTNRRVIFSCTFYPVKDGEPPRDAIVDGDFIVDESWRKKTIREILNEFLGEEPPEFIRKVAHRSEAAKTDRARLLDATLGYLIER